MPLLQFLSANAADTGTKRSREELNCYFTIHKLLFANISNCRVVTFVTNNDHKKRHSFGALMNQHQHLKLKIEFCSHLVFVVREKLFVLKCSFFKIC